MRKYSLALFVSALLLLAPEWKASASRSKAETNTANEYLRIGTLKSYSPGAETPIQMRALAALSASKIRPPEAAPNREGTSESCHDWPSHSHLTYAKRFYRRLAVPPRIHC